jgi:hypothetical protein
MAKLPENSLKYPACSVSYIYALVCPIENSVRYIGKSVDVKNRYRQHLYRLKAGEGQYKVNWIKLLKEKNLKPELKIIGCFDLNEIDKKETFYIQFYTDSVSLQSSKKGLTNLSFGLYDISENTRKSQREAKKKKYNSIGVKQKRDLWEVYISINAERFYCGNFKNKVVAQKVYDAVARNYLSMPVLNFENVIEDYLLTVEKAQQLSSKFSRRRNNFTAYPGISKLSGKNIGKWDSKIKIDNKWIRLGRTNNLERAIEVRDQVANLYAIEVLEEKNKELPPLTILEAKQKLTGKKNKYIGVTATRYGFNVYFNKVFIGSSKNELQAVYIYDCLANKYNKKSNNTTTDYLTIEEAKILIKMMEIKRYSLDSVVQLNKAVIGRTGNMYYPGTYSKGRPLPAKFMTSEYVTLVSGGQDLPQVDNRVVRKETHGGMEETVISPNKPAVEETNLTDQAKILKEKEEIVGLNINTATKQDIIDLDGIGAGTAKKVLQLREIAPFVNYADLNERIGLAFGRDWKDFNIVFE